MFVLTTRYGDGVPVALKAHYFSVDRTRFEVTQHSWLIDYNSDEGPPVTQWLGLLCMELGAVIIPGIDQGLAPE